LRYCKIICHIYIPKSINVTYVPVTLSRIICQTCAIFFLSPFFSLSLSLSLSPSLPPSPLSHNNVFPFIFITHRARTSSRSSSAVSKNCQQNRAIRRTTLLRGGKGLLIEIRAEPSGHTRRRCASIRSGRIASLPDIDVIFLPRAEKERKRERERERHRRAGGEEEGDPRRRRYSSPLNPPCNPFSRHRASRRSQRAHAHAHARSSRA